MRRLAFAAFALAAASACGPTDANGDGVADGIRDPDSVSVVAPSTPQGTVSGQVVNTRLEPMEGAQVSITVGSAAEEGVVRTGATGADGMFRFDRVPAGSQVLVNITRQGFGTARTTVVVPSSAGNFPINNGNASVGPYALTELNGSFQVLVITRSGRPAAGARVVVEASPAALRLSESNIFGSSQGATYVEATTDDSGLATISGVPSPEEMARFGGRYDVWVPPLDENGDGIFDSAGEFITYFGQDLMLDPSPRVIALPDARDPGSLQLLATNVPSLRFGTPISENLIRAGEAIYLVFNQALELKSALVQLTDETGEVGVAIGASLGATGNVLQLSPGQTLQPGKEFNLSVRVSSLDSGDTFLATGYFVAGELGQPFPPDLTSIQIDDATGDGALNTGERVYVSFNTPLGLTTGNGGLQAFINADINSSGSIGDVAGETGSANGFPVFPDEPNGLPDGKFFLKSSGYTTRYVFVYSSGTATIAAGTNVLLAFEKIQTAYGEYETAWGEPVIKNMNAGLTILP